MSAGKRNTVRRKFLATLAKGAVAVPFSTLCVRSIHADAMPRLPTDDPQAVALKYVEQSVIEGQTCDGCQLYLASKTDGWGSCSIFPGSLVAGEGWCLSWVKKANVG